MSNWRNIEIGKVINFNPSESIKKGTIAKKIPMDKLTVFEKKIKGFELSEYSAGPKFRNGDTLVAKITPCLENGKTAQVDVLAENEVAFGSSEFIVLRENENTINDYIFYLAKSPAFRKRAISCMEGTSGRKRVNEGALKLQVLPIPDKLTQKKIAKVLSDLDAKIELNNRINTELEAMAKTLYDYWFVQFDFPYSLPSEGCPQDGVGIGKPYKTSGGKMVWNEELKREIPVGWEVGELKDIANITMGQSPPGESYNEEGNGMIFYQGCTDFGNRFPTIRKYTTSPTRFAKQGDILLSVRAPVGTLNISKEDCCIGRGLACMNSKNDAITYLFGVMVNLKQTFDRRNASGTTFGSITKDDLFSLPVIIPNEKTVRAFQNLVFPSFEKQNKIELENIELASLRDWLLPMLMNGQVSVGDVEEELGMVAEERELYKK